MLKTKKKHNYDKQLINVSQLNAGTAQKLLYTSTYPCVVCGIVINGTTTTTYSTNPIIFQWFIMIVRQGESTTPPISFDNGLGAAVATIPEEHVIVFGAGCVSTTTFAPCECKTKTSRKLMAGDKLYFFLSTAVPLSFNVCYCYTIQFFLRT